MRQALAGAVLAVHLGVIAFNVFGLVAVPVGAWRGWRFVRGPRWRALHLASLAVVAAQALLGQACVLTLWQDALSGRADRAPLIMSWVNRIVYWPLPMWAFAVGYALVFLYTVALWIGVPPRRAAALAAMGGSPPSPPPCPSR